MWSEKKDYISKIKDTELDEHQERVANLSLFIAINMGLESQICEHIYMAGLLHDEGKKYIDKKILNMPRRLTVEEMSIVRQHVFYGSLDAFKKGHSPTVIKYIFSHHENYDGTGYPTNLKNNEIPIGARIIRIVDTFDALTNKRVYRNEKLSTVEALKIMEEEKRYYDPVVYENFKYIIEHNYMKFEGHFVPS